MEHSFISRRLYRWGQGTPVRVSQPMERWNKSKYKDDRRKVLTSHMEYPMLVISNQTCQLGGWQLRSYRISAQIQTPRLVIQVCTPSILSLLSSRGRFHNREFTVLHIKPIHGSSDMSVLIYLLKRSCRTFTLSWESLRMVFQTSDPGPPTNQFWQADSVMLHHSSWYTHVSSIGIWRLE